MAVAVVPWIYLISDNISLHYSAVYYCTVHYGRVQYSTGQESTVLYQISANSSLQPGQLMDNVPSLAEPVPGQGGAGHLFPTLGWSPVCVCVWGYLWPLGWSPLGAVH